MKRRRWRKKRSNRSSYKHSHVHTHTHTPLYSRMDGDWQYLCEQKIWAAAKTIIYCCRRRQRIVTVQTHSRAHIFICDWTQTYTAQERMKTSNRTELYVRVEITNFFFNYFHEKKYYVKFSNWTERYKVNINYVVVSWQIEKRKNSSFRFGISGLFFEFSSIDRSS